MYRFVFATAVLVGFVVATSSPASAQTRNAEPGRRALVTGVVDDRQLVALRGNTRSSANTANDRGRVSDSLALDHLMLQLQRPPELESALAEYIAELSNPASSNYHKWLTPAQFGEQFGLAQSDLTSIVNWLESRGFVINQIYPNKTVIDFSGTAGQVRQAFHTEMHRIEVDGNSHLSNMSDPEIPAALSPAIAGIASLNDFRPVPMKRARAAYTFTSGNSTYQAVVPADIATIYNLNPLFSAGLAGQGQTIVVIENTNVYSAADWTTFRNTFGLTSKYPTGAFTQTHPGGCSNPGIVGGNDGEAILDAEWASAAAPAAAIQLASCRDSATTFGGLIALQNLLNSGSAPAIVSISYGECEAENGVAANASYRMVYQQAVAQGVSVFVSSGDEGAASCDAGASSASHGIGVSGFASTPYNVAVGGTDFGDTFAGSNGDYWNSTNGPFFDSAKSYVPEIPWNDSCASALLASYAGYSSSAGSSGFCNSSMGKSFLTTASGSGGPSGCATGNPSNTGVVSGTCAGYQKPSWQAGVLGNPQDGVRDIPDISLFAANGVWGHYFVYCWSDRFYGGTSCSGAPSSWSGAGGTSFSAPIMAGIQALVNQKTNARWGNPNPIYYSLAASEFGSEGNGACNSTNGNETSPECIFHDVTQGDIDVNCTGAQSCFGYSTSGRGRAVTTTYGVLYTLTTTDEPAFGTSVGWDFATGLGTVNAFNLVMNWSANP